MAGSPNGIRTRVSTLRGWCPRPLDDGAVRGARFPTRSASQDSGWPTRPAKLDHVSPQRSIETAADRSGRAEVHHEPRGDRLGSWIVPRLWTPSTSSPAAFSSPPPNGAVPLDTPVPTCPGWDVARLVQHLGFIHSRVAFVVSNQRTKAPDPGELSPAPDGAASISWFAEQRTAMLAALTAADGDALVWNWTADSPGPVNFWFRRMAHETLIHRVDIELAHGSEPARRRSRGFRRYGCRVLRDLLPPVRDAAPRDRTRRLPPPPRHGRLRCGVDARLAPGRGGGDSRARQGRRRTSRRSVRPRLLDLGSLAGGAARDFR